MTRVGISTRPSTTAGAARDDTESQRVLGQPHPQLRKVAPRGYTGVSFSGTPHEVMLPATPAVSLVVKLADSPRRPPQFVLSAHDAIHLPPGACAPSYLELWLAPLDAYTVLGVPLGDIGDETIDLVDVLGPSGRRLGERLRDSPDWDHRFRLVDEFLFRRLREGPLAAPEVHRAWRRTVSSAGSVPIGDLVREVGWSHRHLISRFRQQVGLTPKRAASVVRFENVLRQVRATAQPDWAWIAADAGYVDQSHLIRDFRRFGGTTPTDFGARTGAIVSHPVLLPGR